MTTTEVTTEELLVQAIDGGGEGKRAACGVLKERARIAGVSLIAYLRRELYIVPAAAPAADAAWERAAEAIRNVADDDNVRRIGGLILATDWDGSDPSGQCKKPPAEMLAFLRDGLDGPPKRYRAVEVDPSTYGGLWRMELETFMRAYSARKQQR